MFNNISETSQQVLVIDYFKSFKKSIEFFKNYLIQNVINDFSGWHRTGFNPTNMYRIRSSDTEKLFIFEKLYIIQGDDFQH